MNISHVNYIVKFIFSVRNYTSLDELYEALMGREVKGVLIESNIASSRSDLFSRDELTVLRLIDYPLSYGYVLSGDARNLRKYIAIEVDKRQIEIMETMKNLTGYIEVINTLEKVNKCLN